MHSLPPDAWWNLYFVTDAYDPRDRRADLAQQLITYFSTQDGFSWMEQARPLCSWPHGSPARVLTRTRAVAHFPSCLR